ncbi:hypothetical protein CRUP_028644, partial [Coryphaenoides rupestris]
MAVRQRIFNSTAPFCGPPQAELKGRSLPDQGGEAREEEKEEEGKAKEEEGGSKVDFMAINPYLSKVLTRGTAEQVGEGPLKNSTFVAQAECETQDSQEFSPSCSDRCYVPSPNCFTSKYGPPKADLPAPLPPPPLARKKMRKRPKRKERKKEGGKKKEKPRRPHHVPSGVPEQESGTSPIQFLRVESLPWSTQACDHLPSYGQDSNTGSSLGSSDCTLALAGLRGSVSQVEPCFAGPFFKDVEKEVRVEEEDEVEAAEEEEEGPS